jgi:hypothetical protein
MAWGEAWTQWIRHGRSTREQVLERVALGEELPEFLTLPAYDHLD